MSQDLTSESKIEKEHLTIERPLHGMPVDVSLAEWDWNRNPSLLVNCIQDNFNVANGEVKNFLTWNAKAARLYVEWLRKIGSRVIVLYKRRSLSVVHPIVGGPKWITEDDVVGMAAIGTWVDMEENLERCGPRWWLWRYGLSRLGSIPDPFQYRTFREFFDLFPTHNVRDHLKGNDYLLHLLCVDRVYIPNGYNWLMTRVIQLAREINATRRFGGITKRMIFYLTRDQGSDVTAVEKFMDENWHVFSEGVVIYAPGKGHSQRTVAYATHFV